MLLKLIVIKVKEVYEYNLLFIRLINSKMNGYI